MVRAHLARMEGSARALTLVKLVNVVLAMLWGFAVTYVYVRALPQSDFRAFLLLVAFNNFTVSAEFGLTNVIYSRLRRFWLAERDGGTGDFRREEIGALFVALLLLILVATLAVSVLLVLGIIPTHYPLLFLLFFLASALNVQALLAKRGLAAIDRNLLWEALDVTRRVISLLALAAVIAGLNLIVSVGIQLTASLAAIALAIVVLHRRLGMTLGQWFAWRAGGGHMRRTYMHDIGASVALTISEIVAYNSPYFVIAAMTHETRMLLLFDFVFKMSRAVSTAIRATIEAVLPRISRAFFAADAVVFRAVLLRSMMIACAVALCACAILIAVGQRVFATLFDGNAALSMDELLMTCGVLLALALICTSVYVQGALGRFRHLLAQSLPFLGGSLLVMPLTVALVGNRDAQAMGVTFMVLYAAVFAGVAGLHMLSLRRLAAHVGGAAG
mgnify:FL=1